MSTAARTNKAEEALLQDESLLSFCKASGDQLRLAILGVLSHDSYSVLELCRIFDHRQSGMSHHLKILAKAGLVSTRREGNSIFYRRAGKAQAPALEVLQQALFAQCADLPLAKRVRAAVKEVQEERERRSRAFFAEMGEQFQVQQEQIAAPSVYLDASADLLREAAPKQTRRALEIGAGEGNYLPVLGELFDEVFVFDTSEEMLNKARGLAQREGLDNVHFLPSDAQDAANDGQAYDCIVANMVLHHVPSPAGLIEQQAQQLESGGLLCLTDLCSHHQNWAREACGDLWLGFEPEELNEWAVEAGLLEHKSTYLALRNGFQVQVRQFIKQ